ncbi:MAG: penicillin-binding transpeptidase domain-containing protein, partial [Halanaerobiales bacterium]
DMGVKDQASDRILDEDTAGTMTELMVEVVEGGTGKRIDIEDIKIAGKTGTAEIDSSDTTHAWFVGFAPAEEPEVAFAVFCERGGVGGEVAAPIAGNLIKNILEFDKLN